MKYRPLKKYEIVTFKNSHIKEGKIYVPFSGVMGFRAGNYNIKIYKKIK